MATAIKLTKVATEPRFVDNGVRLELTQAEAVALKIVLGHIGGHPKTTARCYTDGITVALFDAGIRSPDTDEVLLTYESGTSLYFTDASRGVVEST
jgi:hypothetical protein